MSRSIRRAMCASRAFRMSLGMRGPSALVELFGPEATPRGSADLPTRRPATARSAAGLTLAFSETIAGLAAAPGAGFLSADRDSLVPRQNEKRAAQDATTRRTRRGRIESAKPLCAHVLVGP